MEVLPEADSIRLIYHLRAGRREDGTLVELYSRDNSGRHRSFSLSMEEKKWVLNLECKTSTEVSTKINYVALSVTIQNYFGPWEFFRFQKCFQARLTPHRIQIWGKPEYVNVIRFEAENTLCSAKELEGLVASSGPIGKLTLRIEPIHNEKEMEVFMVERTSSALAHNVFYKNWKTDCCIKTSDDVFHCHKEKLTAQSEAISRLAQMEQEKGTNGMFVMDWSDYMNSQGVQAFLNFLYFFELRDIRNADAVFQMIQVADLYLMKDLVKACEILMLTMGRHLFEPEPTVNMFLYLKKCGKYADIQHRICSIMTRNFSKYEEVLREKSRDYPLLVMDIWQAASVGKQPDSSEESN